MPPKNYYINLRWTDPNSGRSYERSELPPVTLGRRENNTITLDSSQVSRTHARLDNIEGQTVLTDLESANGTHLNGRRIRQAVLQNGSQFQIGPFTLTFSVGRAEESVAGPGKVRCPNPQCQRVVAIQHRDCPWCGYSLSSGSTVYRE